MSHARRVALPCWPFELSPLNEFYRGKLVHSITLRYFNDIWCKYISGEDGVSHTRGLLPLAVLLSYPT